MSGFRSLGVLCALLAGAVFSCLPAAGATAGLLREVRVGVHNDTRQTIKVEVYEAESGFRVHYHHRESKTLHPGQSFVAETGAYSDRDLVIATSLCEHHPHGMHGMRFENPLIGHPTAQTVLARSDGFWIHPGRGGSHSFGEGGRHEFWDGAVHVTRHNDSRDYIEFTERILHQECPS